jgi:gamma-tubulin complex component 3
MSVRWMLDGVIDDPHGEFWITCDAGSLGVGRAWDERFRMRAEMVPAFVGREVAEKILVAGKTVSFIRNECGDAQWKAGADVSAALTATGVWYGKPVEFAAAVDLAAECAGKRLLELALARAPAATKKKQQMLSVVEHVAAIKKYLLLGQGDFAQALMEQLSRELSQPSITLFRHNLMPVLEGAMRVSNAQYDTREILDRVDIRLQESSPEKSGWETFSLTYGVDEGDGPLAALLPAKVMDMYSSLFSTLWAIKRAEHELSNAWRSQATAARSLSSRRGRYQLPERASGISLAAGVLREEMAHFVSNLRHFVMDDVIEPAWAAFCESATTQAKCFDAVIRAHRAFVQAITDRGLVTSPTSRIRATFYRLLNDIASFAVAQEAFFDSAVQESSRGEPAVAGDSEPSEFELSLLAVEQRMREIGGDFREHFGRLLIELSRRTTSDPSVRSLLLRLDFNGFYARCSLPSPTAPSRPLTDSFVSPNVDP